MCSREDVNDVRFEGRHETTGRARLEISRTPVHYIGEVFAYPSPTSPLPRPSIESPLLAYAIQRQRGIQLSLC